MFGSNIRIPTYEDQEWPINTISLMSKEEILLGQLRPDEKVIFSNSRFVNATCLGLWMEIRGYVFQYLIQRNPTHEFYTNKQSNPVDISLPGAAWADYEVASGTARGIERTSVKQDLDFWSGYITPLIGIG